MKFYLTTILTLVMALTPLCALAGSSQDSPQESHRGGPRRRVRTEDFTRTQVGGWAELNIAIRNHT